MILRLPLLLAFACLAACSKEARDIGPSLPQTPPLGNGDPRIAAYQDNVYQVSQGGRYFSWYGCMGCHADDAPGARNLPDGRWRHGGGFAQVFTSIAKGHGGLDYGARIPTEQLWQLTAYVRDLPTHTPEKRRRLAVDQQAEPQGSTWSGPQ